MGLVQENYAGNRDQTWSYWMVKEAYGANGLLLLLFLMFLCMKMLIVGCKNEKLWFYLTLLHFLQIMWVILLYQIATLWGNKLHANLPWNCVTANPPLVMLLPPIPVYVQAFWCLSYESIFRHVGAIHANPPSHADTSFANYSWVMLIQIIPTHRDLLLLFMSIHLNTLICLLPVHLKPCWWYSSKSLSVMPMLPMPSHLGIQFPFMQVHLNSCWCFLCQHPLGHADTSHANPPYVIRNWRQCTSRLCWHFLSQSTLRHADSSPHYSTLRTVTAHANPSWKAGISCTSPP